MLLLNVLGITVLGGENSKRLDLGIYVKSVTEGGAAWKDGRLKAGKITTCKIDFCCCIECFGLFQDLNLHVANPAQPNSSKTFSVDIGSF